MPAAQNTIRVEGLRDFVRDLGKLDGELRKEVVGTVRKAAITVRTEARGLAPVRTGSLARSIRSSASTRGAKIVSALPYAGVHEYGGTVRPKGTPITIRASKMVGRAIDHQAAPVERELERVFERVARDAGFK